MSRPRKTLVLASRDSSRSTFLVLSRSFITLRWSTGRYTSPSWGRAMGEAEITTDSGASPPLRVAPLPDPPPRHDTLLVAGRTRLARGDS